jgi:hypothetical protein
MTRAAWIAVGGVSALALGLAVALVIALAGAGDDDEPGTPQGPAVLTPGGAPSEEFQDCMSENGVEPPQPGVPQQAPPAGLEEALEACRDLLPEGAEPGSLGPLRISPG